MVSWLYTALVLDRKRLSVSDSNKINGAFYHIFSTSSKLDNFSIIKLITFPLTYEWDFSAVQYPNQSLEIRSLKFVI